MEQQLASLTSLTFDTNLYCGSDKDSYLTSIPANKDQENLDAVNNEVARKLASYTAPKSLLKEMPGTVGDGDAELGFRKPQRIIDREDDYRCKRLNQVISLERHDPFAASEKTTTFAFPVCGSIRWQVKVSGTMVWLVSIFTPHCPILLNPNQWCG